MAYICENDNGSEYVGTGFFENGYWNVLARNIRFYMFLKSKQYLLHPATMFQLLLLLLIMALQYIKPNYITPLKILRKLQQM